MNTPPSAMAEARPPITRSGAAPRALGHKAELALFAVLFFSIASVCSIPRFGQRENESLPAVSDSDLYIDMAHVFTGDAPAFNAAYLQAAPHHYNRPLFPWLAGYLSKYALQGNLRAAFSLVDLLAATGVAVLLMLWVKQSVPGASFAWLPSVLFLTGFPQMDWGYHILTDTLGLATAFAAAYYAAWLLRRTGGTAGLRPAVWVVHLVAVGAASSVAFLARETGWFAVITAGFVVLASQAPSGAIRLRRILVVATLAAGVLPHAWYARHFHTSGVAIPLLASTLLQPAYLLDWFVKTGVCFNLCWLAAVGAVVAMVRKHDWPIPAWILGWTLAGILYMGAAYGANSITSIGYPLRISYGLFPLVFFLTRQCFLEWIAPARRRLSIAGFCVIQYAVNLFGVTLDSGKGKMTIVDLAHKMMHALGR